MNDALKRRARPAGLTVLLTSMIGLNPIAIDAYLPALTMMVDDLSSELQVIEHSISTYMLGYALGLILAAPTSDRTGRRPVALCGLFLFVLATLAVALSQSAGQLITFRIIQGIGAGVALVNVGAIVRDLFDERESARQLSMINAMLMTLPLVAPVFGAAVLAAGSWRWIFGGILIYALVVLLAVVLLLPETARRGQGATNPRGNSLLGEIVEQFGKVLAHRRASAFALTAAASAGTLFLFLSDAAFVYMDYFGLSAAVFPFAFGANVILMAIMQIINIALLKRLQPRQILPWGVGALLITTLTFLSYCWLFDPAFYVVVAFVVLTLGSQSLIVNNAIAAYMSRFDENAGMANAISGALTFVFGAVAALLLGVLHDGTVRSLATGFFMVAAIAAISMRVALREHDREEIATD